MSSQEIQLTLTAEQAAAGTVISVNLADGPVNLRIPPTRNGDLIRAQVAGKDVLLRILVTGGTFGATTPMAAAAPAGPGSPGAPGAPAKNVRAGILGALGLIAAFAVVVLLVNNDDDSRNTANSNDKASASASPSDTPVPGQYSPPATPAPTYMATESTPSQSAAPAPDPTPSAAYPVTPTSEAPTPFDRGTCLNGQLPDSTTAQRVTDVNEVPCTASDAHYRVIESIPFTSDMDRCNTNSKTEYAFSYRYTLGGSVLNEYVYCLVGIGSYSRR
ncbi:hypothetical protein AB0D46_22760 [Streptomyces sp. NPDC048383]|uniref:LppU/SCO3897 family protein n=1 Tax=Streptomyces sp. NPDC048383 TaxID=3155386 RepID=UPI003416B53C